ncbi:hypothetical protein CK623_07615 [Vandammella animalimorsus]|uniref:Uncharacterized protein n=2 Tax=Vandammella animalimorsus TaxID=2029117 RepID=A0A2A2AQJ0_9BURK|nr:hypothetical protein CK623_07615 [Vandammella animalimorsus]
MQGIRRIIRLPRSRPKQSFPSPALARVAAAIEYLYDHAREQPSLEARAAHVHLSPNKMLQRLSLAHAKAVLAACMIRSSPSRA